MNRPGLINTRLFLKSRFRKNRVPINPFDGNYLLTACTLASFYPFCQRKTDLSVRFLVITTLNQESLLVFGKIEEAIGFLDKFGAR